MNLETCALRREKLRKLLHAQHLAALIVSLDANRYYLSGFELHDTQINESSGFLVITTDGHDWLCTDARFTDAAKRLWDENYIAIYQRSAAATLQQILAPYATRPIGFEGAVMPYNFYASLCTDLHMVPADGLIESLRIIKDAEEIRRLKLSCALNHQLMQWLPSRLMPGKTEKALAWEIEQFFRNNGAEDLSFPSIVAVGANAALPHAIPGETPITENCGILIDTGCRLQDYCSDQTRSFWVGTKPDPTFTSDIQLVQQAQRVAIESVRPGALCSDIYAKAYQVLDQAGQAHRFTHGLGHGIGLQTHERPSLGSQSTTILQPGMVVTIEPGLYHPGKGGVRWEHMVLVTEDGCEIL